MPQFVRNSPITHWKSSPLHQGFHRFPNAPQLPTSTRDCGKANSFITATVFHYVAICAELSLINSLEIVSWPSRIPAFSQAAHLLTPTPDPGKVNSNIADTVFHNVAICAELSLINSLEIVS